MITLNLKARQSIAQQTLTAGSLVILVSSVCYLLSSWIDYKSVALILLVLVSILAMFYSITPVLLAAFLSAGIWDFIFIHPQFAFLPQSTDDALMLLMYFIVASLNAVLTGKFRKAEELARQKEEKANAIKLYNDLLNSLSHELRTPIAIIIGNVDNLMEGEEQLPIETRKDLLNEISIAGLKLNEQVENLLNMSRLESGFIKAQLNWCDIILLLYEEIDALGETIQSHVIQMDIMENLPYVYVDYGLMKHSIRNLLQNAIRYTPAGTHIYIRASYQIGIFTIIIEDDGPGFPPEEIELVFDKFYRLKNSKPGGTGLGLSITKGFIEAQGGSILLRNNTMGGATFEIKLPTDAQI